MCLRLAAFPHYCTHPDVTWGNCRGYPVVAHCCVDLQSAHGFYCYDNMALNMKCLRVLVLALYLVLNFVFINVKPMASTAVNSWWHPSHTATGKITDLSKVTCRMPSCFAGSSVWLCVQTFCGRHLNSALMHSMSSLLMPLNSWWTVLQFLETKFKLNMPLKTALLKK